MLMAFMLNRLISNTDYIYQKYQVDSWKWKILFVEKLIFSESLENFDGSLVWNSLQRASWVSSW